MAEQLGKDPATISKWCTNSSQPDLATLARVAALLEVDVKDLLNSTQPKDNFIIIQQKS
ncbi:toxin-antitoxin system, antitoxin component, Xre family [Bacteroides xylanisolvens SD CC 2a]|nr:toxin-antitoxin system, antitoxin component, Xre family [Bacteroides xylanisolvens SD CC 2a]